MTRLHVRLRGHAGLALTILLFARLASAGESILEKKITINVWHDTPSEVLHEISLRTPPHQRPAWHATSALDDKSWPGPVVELKDQTIKAVLEAYVGKTGLKWSADGRHLWIWESVDEQKQKAWQTEFEGDDTVKQSQAASRLVQHANPAVVSFLLASLGSSKKTTASAAYGAVSRFLGTSPKGHIKARAYDLWRHPDRSKHRTSPLSEYGYHLRAPWAGMMIALKDEAAKKGAIAAVKASKGLARDVVLLSIAACLKMPEGKVALEKWKKDPKTVDAAWGGWEHRYIKSPVGRILDWAFGAGPKEPDYAAQAAEALVAIKKQKPSEKMKDRALKGVRRAIDAKLRHGWGPETLAALTSLLLEGPHPVIRGSAANALASWRQPGIVVPLKKCFTEDKQPKNRRAAAEALAASREPAAIEALKTALQGEGSLLGRKHAAQALAESKHPKAGTWIREHIDKAEGAERQAMIQFLGLTRDTAITAHLIELMNNAKTPMPERQSAVIALSLIPQKAASDALVKVLMSDASPELREWTIQGVTPKTFADVDRFLKILMAALDAENTERLRIKILEGVQLCARVIPSGDPRKSEIADRALALIQDSKTTNNVRKKALETFKYTDNGPHIAKGLEAQLAKEKHPVMKSFIRIALKNATRK